MAFESYPSDSGTRKSPGGHVFGIEGWTWGDPVPKSITFFLDNTAMVCDQYGRHIRRALLHDGREIRFADSPPEANREGEIFPRPQFATHKQTIDALSSERFSWLSYQIEYTALDGSRRTRKDLTVQEAVKVQQKLIQEGNKNVVVMRSIECVGWPQLTYEELKTLPQLPPTPMDELRKILDPELRRAALRIKREYEEERNRSRNPVDEEET